MPNTDQIKRNAADEVGYPRYQVMPYGSMFAVFDHETAWYVTRPDGNVWDHWIESVASAYCDRLNTPSELAQDIAALAAYNAAHPAYGPVGHDWADAYSCTFVGIDADGLATFRVS